MADAFAVKVHIGLRCQADVWDLLSNHLPILKDEASVSESVGVCRAYFRFMDNLVHDTFKPGHHFDRPD